MEMLTKKSFFEGLIRLNINRGDVLFVRVALKNIGKIDGSYSDFLDWILEYLGPNGTLCCLSFTPVYRLSEIHSSHNFERLTKSNAGGFSNLVLRHSSVVRSAHPTNSFAAIGVQSEYILEGHDETSSCYAPMEKIIKLKAKMLLIGCSKASPGFTSVHWAQHVLGYSTKSFYKKRYGVNHKNKGISELFLKTDFGGCSNGFSNFYSKYIENEILRTGHIGLAFCLSIDAYDAFKVELDLLRKNPRFSFCTNNTCRNCRTSWTFNKRQIPGYIVSKIIVFFKSKFRL
jgi:aminoglycoside 3-N-acetyltransferase